MGKALDQERLGAFYLILKKPNPCTTVNSGLLPLVFESVPLKEVVKQLAKNSKRQKNLLRLAFARKDLALFNEGGVISAF